MAMDQFLAKDKREFECSIANLTKAEIGVIRQLRRKYKNRTSAKHSANKKYQQRVESETTIAKLRTDLSVSNSKLAALQSTNLTLVRLFDNLRDSAKYFKK
jgi:hypothetical protein